MTRMGLYLMGTRIGEGDVTVDQEALRGVLNAYAESVRRAERLRIEALPWWTRIRRAALRREGAGQ